MASFNKVILVGNLTRDPQLKYLPSNMPVCEIGLAVNHTWRDKDGNKKEDVCFVDVAVFGKGGEVVNQYMSKGRSILIEGRLKYDTWTAQDGTKRSKHSVVAENFTFLGERGERGGGGAPAASMPTGGEASDDGPPPAARSAPGAAAPRASGRPAPAQSDSYSQAGNEEDIPF